MTGSIGSLTSASVDRYNMKHRYTDIQDVVISKFVSSAERGHASSDTLDIHTQRNVSPLSRSTPVC